MSARANTDARALALDRETRARAQREFDAPQVVEAGAGTGKTAVLVARILAWCLGAGWERVAEARAAQAQAKARASESAEHEHIARDVLSRVAAITFTVAAAAEMAERLMTGLLNIARGEPVIGFDADALAAAPEVCAARAQALLDASDQITIQTIHAFCLRLLSAYPLSIGLHPRLTVDTDETLYEEVAQQTIERYCASAYQSAESDAFQLMATSEIAPEQLRDGLFALLRASVQPESLVDLLAPARIAAWRSALLAELEAYEEQTEGQLDALRGPKQQALRDALATLPDAVRAMEGTREDFLSLASLVGAHLEEHQERLKKWARGTEGPCKPEDPCGLGEAAQAALRECIARLEPFLTALVQTDFDLLEQSSRVLHELLTAAYEELHRRGIQSYGDMLREAERLLRENPDIRTRVRESYDQLLVDEFQDTDALQCEILRHITQGKGGPTLFLVGDPKQSIYGWRNADLAAYEDFIAEVLAREEKGVLCENFRSVQPILDEVERCLEPIFDAEDAAPGALRPRFQKLLVSEANANDAGVCEAGAAPVEHWLSYRCEDGAPVHKTKSAEAVLVEARALAADVARQIDAGATPSGIGILLRTTGSLDVVLSALRDAGLDYVVERDKNYYQRREVLDASALLRWLLDPNDHLALVALLRSALVGVPDAALLPLWRENFPARAGALFGDAGEELAALQTLAREVALPADVPGLARIEGWRENLAGLLALAGPLRASAETRAPDRFVEGLRRVLLLEASEAGRNLGRFRLANLDRFFRTLAQNLEQHGPSGLLATLRGAVSSAREEEEGRPRTADENAVQVMTIHKAKGLGFEQVYLLQTHKGGMRPSSGRTEALRQRSAEALVLFGQPSLEAPALAQAQRERETLERERVLYVALTRAKRRLVIAGKPGEERVETLSGLLSRRRERPPLDALLTGVLDAHAQDAPPQVDAAGARWVLPALRVESSSARERTARGALSIERAREDAAEIRERRARAQARMKRPAHGTASAEHGARADEAADESAARDDALLAPSAFALFEPPPANADAPQDPDANAVALRAGSAVHAALEFYDPAAGEAGRDAARKMLDAALCEEADEQGPAHQRAHALWEKFLEGPLHKKFCAIAPHIEARELPVHAPPRADDESATAPLHFMSGVVDLLYREPETGAWVVADYKTDDVGADASALEARAAHYAKQGAFYCRALREALQLDETPRFELWFLAAGKIATPPAD